MNFGIRTLRTRTVIVETFSRFSAEPALSNHPFNSVVERRQILNPPGEIATDVQRDIQAYFISEPERAHRHTEIEHNPVDPFQTIAFGEEIEGLHHVGQQDYARFRYADGPAPA